MPRMLIDGRLCVPVDNPAPRTLERARVRLGRKRAPDYWAKLSPRQYAMRDSDGQPRVWRVVRPRKPRTIHISARKWFDRVNGNTYHSYYIFIDGHHTLTNRMEYGYGDQWQWYAARDLDRAGYMPGRHIPGESLRAYCLRLRIVLSTDCVDVSRKRDLHQ